MDFILNTGGTDINIDISSDIGTDTFSVNQRLNGGEWISLGSYPFSGSGSVTFEAPTETMPDGRYVTTWADEAAYGVVFEGLQLSYLM